MASVAEAMSWLRNNRETWRGALEDDEPVFEMWVVRDGSALIWVEMDKQFGSHGTIRLVEGP